jgi:chromosome partitioning protein
MGAVVAMVARKGGVGKTTLAANLAGVYAAGGLSVRLVDLDPQASLTAWCLGMETVETLAPHETVEAVLAGGRSDAVERETRWERITLLASHLKLRPANPVPTGLRSPTADLTILDTPPDLTNPLAKAALLAADFVVSPLDPEAFGAQSILAVAGALHSVGVSANPGLRMLGYVVNRRERLAVHAVVEDTLRRLHGDAVFRTVLANASAMKEACLAREPITSYAPRSKAAAAISELAEEVMERIAAVAATKAA